MDMVNDSDFKSKVVVFAIAFVVFVIVFFVMDNLLQSYQGLELFPGKGGH